MQVDLSTVDLDTLDLDAIDEGAVDREVARLEAALAAARLKRPMPYAKAKLDPVPEHKQQATWTSVQEAKLAPMDSASDVTTEAGSSVASESMLMSDVDDSCVKCKYYTVLGGEFLDLNGGVHTAKWAKRMRQKEKSEEAGTGASSSSSAATANVKDKALEGKGVAEVKVKGTRATAVPESDRKHA